MKKNRASRSVVKKSRKDEKTAGAGCAAGTSTDLGLLANSSYLRRLRATVTETYASLSSNQTEAEDAVEKTIAALARPEMPLDPALKSELIGKLGALLTKLEQLHGMLPEGETLALNSLDRANDLLNAMNKKA